jgi:hypothetical protein
MVIGQRLRPLGFTGGLSILKDYLHAVRAHTAAKRAYVRMEPGPGERFEIDWGHFGALLYQGYARKLYAFCLVECHSRKLFVEFTHSQGQDFHEAGTGPRFQEFLDAKRRDHGNAGAVEVTFPAEAIGVEGQKREEKARDREKYGHGPVVNGLAPTFCDVACGQGSLRAFAQLFFFIVQERKFGIERDDFRIVGEGDTLGFVGAETVCFVQNFGQSFAAEFFARGLYLGFVVHGASLCCLAEFIRL